MRNQSEFSSGRDWWSRSHINPVSPASKWRCPSTMIQEVSWVGKYFERKTHLSWLEYPGRYLGMALWMGEIILRRGADLQEMLQVYHKGQVLICCSCPPANLFGLIFVVVFFFFFNCPKHVYLLKSYQFIFMSDYVWVLSHSFLVPTYKNVYTCQNIHFYVPR